MWLNKKNNNLPGTPGRTLELLPPTFFGAALHAPTFFGAAPHEGEEEEAREEKDHSIGEQC